MHFMNCLLIDDVENSTRKGDKTTAWFVRKIPTAG